MEIYLCIDLKSFYASVECRLRKLDPLHTALVVADKSRTEKTICLAATPFLKQFGIKGRSRLFEVNEIVKNINLKRLKKGESFKKYSYKEEDLKDLNVGLGYICATPQMKKYIEFSKKIYEIYLKYVAKEDIHVYSIDEVFIDITPYLKLIKSPFDLANQILNEIFLVTGLTATCGIGTNLYLAKVSMDILAKKTEPNEHGNRIAYLDEMSYRRLLWNHKPLSDFWRIGKKIELRLSKYDILTMGDLAYFSLHHEDRLFKEFGVNAELLIDHAFGYESVKMKDIKAYKPLNKSITVGQVLHCPYSFDKALLIIKEMAEEISIKLLEKEILAGKMVLHIGYDIENMKLKNVKEIEYDRVGREVPKSSHGTISLNTYTNLASLIKEALITLYNDIINKNYTIRRINIIAIDLKDSNEHFYTQLNLFDEPKNTKDLEIEKTILNIKKRYGKNSLLKASNLTEDSNQIKRNNEIGGHKA